SSIFFSCSLSLIDLHSFPTRRSSDLGTGKLMIATSKLAASVIAPVVPEATYMLDGLERISHGEIPSKIAAIGIGPGIVNEALVRSEEHTSELQSRFDLVCRLLLEKKN